MVRVPCLRAFLIIYSITLHTLLCFRGHGTRLEVLSNIEIPGKGGEGGGRGMQPNNSRIY